MKKFLFLVVLSLAVTTAANAEDGQWFFSATANKVETSFNLDAIVTDYNANSDTVYSVIGWSPASLELANKRALAMQQALADANIPTFQAQGRLCSAGKKPGVTVYAVRPDKVGITKEEVGSLIDPKMEEMDGKLAVVDEKLEKLKGATDDLAKRPISLISILIGLESYGEFFGPSRLDYLGGGAVVVRLNLRPLTGRNIISVSGLVGTSGGGADIGGSVGYGYELGDIPIVRVGGAIGYRGVALNSGMEATIGSFFIGPEAGVRLLYHEHKPHWVEPWLFFAPVAVYSARADGTTGFCPGFSLSVMAEFDAPSGK